MCHIFFICNRHKASWELLMFLSLSLSLSLSFSCNHILPPWVLHNSSHPQQKYIQLQCQLRQTLDATQSGHTFKFYPTWIIIKFNCTKCFCFSLSLSLSLSRVCVYFASLCLTRDTNTQSEVAVGHCVPHLVSLTTRKWPLKFSLTCYWPSVLSLTLSLLTF